MGAALRTVKKLSQLIETKPVVAVCLSGRKKFADALKELGLSTTLKSLNFNHAEWSCANMAVSKVKEEELDKSTGMHVVKDARKHTGDKTPIGDDVEALLALLFKQHKKEFLLSRKNHYVVLQDTAHTGASLEIARKALLMNGIPRENIVTAAFRSSVSTVFLPDVCGEKALLKVPRQRKPDSWLRISHAGEDILVNVPAP